MSPRGLLVLVLRRGISLSNRAAKAKIIYNELVYIQIIKASNYIVSAAAAEVKVATFFLVCSTKSKSKLNCF